jgi:hypothetical protein
MLQVYKLLLEHCEENMEHRLYLNEMVSIDYFPNLEKAYIQYKNLDLLISAKSLDDAHCKFMNNISYYIIQEMICEEKIQQEINEDIPF